MSGSAFRTQFRTRKAGLSSTGPGGLTRLASAPVWSRPAPRRSAAGQRLADPELSGLVSMAAVKQVSNTEESNVGPIRRGGKSPRA